MARAAAVAVTLALALGLSCAYTDYGQTPYLCGVNGECPDGYVCQAGVCARKGAGSSSVDAAGGGGSDAGGQGGIGGGEGGDGGGGTPDARVAIDAAEPPPDASPPDALPLDAPPPDGGGGVGGRDGGRPDGGGGRDGGGGADGGSDCGGLGSTIPACDSCFRDHCCSRGTTCGNNPDCLSLLDCTRPCTTNSCLQDCATQFPGGVSAYNALNTCMNDNCSTDCM
jgi:hypothetical protein